MADYCTSALRIAPVFKVHCASECFRDNVNNLFINVKYLVPQDKELHWERNFTVTYNVDHKLTAARVGEKSMGWDALVPGFMSVTAIKVL